MNDRILIDGRGVQFTQFKQALADGDAVRAYREGPNSIMLQLWGTRGKTPLRAQVRLRNEQIAALVDVLKTA